VVLTSIITMAQDQPFPGKEKGKESNSHQDKIDIVFDVLLMEFLNFLDATQMFDLISI
jgi:hypothetical protein